MATATNISNIAWLQQLERTHLLSSSLSYTDLTFSTDFTVNFEQVYFSGDAFKMVSDDQGITILAYINLSWTNISMLGRTC